MKGHVPGNTGGFIYVKDALREKKEKLMERPFPTFIPDNAEMASAFTERVAKMEVDPFLAYN